MGDPIETAGKERVVYESKFFEVCKQPVKRADGIVEFEHVRRPPGVRLIIVEDGKLLLTKEFRFELSGNDYRLPGGKVFDSLQAYKNAVAGGEDILAAAEKVAKKECAEETGLIPTNICHFHTTTPGALVHWDLFYFIVDNFEKGTQNLGHGEKITPEWKTFAEVKQLCLGGQVHEDRSVGVLLRFLLNQ